MSRPSPNTAPPHPIPGKQSVCGGICPRPIVSDSSGGFAICSNANWSQASHQARRTAMNVTAALSKSSLAALDELRAE